MEEKIKIIEDKSLNNLSLSGYREQLTKASKEEFRVKSLILIMTFALMVLILTTFILYLNIKQSFLVIEKNIPKFENAIS